MYLCVLTNETGAGGYLTSQHCINLPSPFIGRLHFLLQISPPALALLFFTNNMWPRGTILLHITFDTFVCIVSFSNLPFTVQSDEHALVTKRA